MRRTVSRRRRPSIGQFTSGSSTEETWVKRSYCCLAFFHQFNEGEGLFLYLPHAVSPSSRIPQESLPPDTTPSLPFNLSFPWPSMTTFLPTRDAVTSLSSLPAPFPTSSSSALHMSEVSLVSPSQGFALCFTGMPTSIQRARASVLAWTPSRTRSPSCAPSGSSRVDSVAGLVVVVHVFHLVVQHADFDVDGWAHPTVSHQIVTRHRL